MFTHNYKGMYIQGHCAKTECTVTSISGKIFKTYRAAQLAISKAVKAHDAAMLQAVLEGRL